MPLGYISWLCYSLNNAIKIVLLFRDIAETLTEDMTFGPNLMKTCIACASVVFFLLLISLADTTPNSPRDAYITSIMWRITLDVLDTVALLDVLFTQDSRILLPFSYQNMIISIAFINILLPTVPLLVLSKSCHGKKEIPQALDMLHLTLYLLLVNVPMFVMRMLLWHVHDENISVFLIKNIISMSMVAKNVYDHLVTLRHTVERENEIEMRESAKDHADVDEHQA